MPASKQKLRKGQNLYLVAVSEICLLGVSRVLQISFSLRSRCHTEGWWQDGDPPYENTQNTWCNAVSSTQHCYFIKDCGLCSGRVLLTCI